VTVAGTPVDLTAKEFDLLAFLGARPGRAFTRDELLRAVWQSASEFQQASTVTEHIRRLRAKVEPDPADPAILVTVRGIGYRFDSPLQAEHGAGASEQLSGALIHVDGVIVFADDHALSIAGATDAAGLIGKSLFDIVAPKWLDAARLRMDVTGHGRPLRSQVVDILRADGSELSIEVTSSETVWDGERAGRVVMTRATDPSARLRHLATGVFSDLSDAVIVTDLNAHIRSWNDAAERLYGWAEHEVLGRHLVDVLPWLPGERALEAAWLSLENDGRWHGEGHQTARDGSLVSVLVTTTLVRDERGEPLGIVSVNRAAREQPRPGSLPTPDEPSRIDLERGIEHGELEVYYQPVVALADQRIIAVEALVRWNHPSRGVLDPDDFLDMAEHCDLILELGAFVLDSACRQAALWRDSGADIELAVNLSARELADPNLLDRIDATLAATRFDPDSLWLEVTETSLVEALDQAAKRLHHLADHGIRIAIDDFGTGWASLTYLSQFPVHALKIDQSFVAAMEHSPHAVAIAKSIISLGRELDLTVIPEGIETADQAHALQGLGCSRGQGFLYGRPTPAGAVEIARAARR
jgi:PAS domain S-box-containing protein